MEKIIAIDIDNVLNNFSEVLKTADFEDGGKPDMYRKHIDDIRRDCWDRKDLDIRYYARYIHQQCYIDAKPVDGAAAFTKALKDKRYTIVIMTHRDLSISWLDTGNWLSGNNIKYDYLTHTANKLSMCKRWGITSLVEKNLNVITDAAHWGIKVYYPMSVDLDTCYRDDNTCVYGFYNFDEVLVCLD